MADINEILGRQINSVKELKAAIKELQDSLVGVDAESEEFKTTSEQLAAAQAELNKVTRAGKEDNDAAADSIRGMEKEYKALYDTYKMLSEEQRNSDFGKGMAESLEQMSTKINDAKKEVGNFSSNIGRYAQGVTDAFNNMGISVGGLQAPLKAATGGAKSFGTALKSLAANPIVLVITALVAILAKAAAAIKQNEELTNRLQQAMATFKPVLDAIANAFDFLAGLLVKTVEGLAKVAEKIMSVIPGMKQAVKSHQDLAKATNDLTKAQREANVENSKKTAEIERLREEASATDDVIEKKKLLEEAKALQAEVDQKNIELAQEELRIMEEYADKTANSAADNEKLAAAQRKVNDAIAQGERNMRQYNKQISATEKSTKSVSSAQKSWREEADKLYQQLEEDSKSELQKLEEKYKKEKDLFIRAGKDTTKLTKKYNEDRLEIIIKEVKKERDTVNAHLDGQIDNINRYYQNLKSFESDSVKAFIEGKRLEALKDFLKAQEAQIKAQIETTQGNIQAMWNYIFNNADLRKLDDFNYIKEFLSVFTTQISQEDVQKIISGFNEIATQIGEEGWIGLTSGLTNTIKNLNNVGIDIKNLPDFQARMADLGNDAAEQFGNAFIKNLDERSNMMTEALYDALYEKFKNNDYNEVFTSATEWASKVEYEHLEVQKSLLEEELSNFQGTQEQKIQLLQQYYGIVEELRNRNLAAEQLNAERSWSIYEAANDHFLQMHESLDSILGSIQNVMQAELNSGKLTEKEAKKKRDALKALQTVQLAVAISNIAANTAAGIMDVWRGYSAELPVNAETAAATGPAAAATKAALDAKSLTAAIIRTGTIASQGTAQLAAAVGGYVANTKSASGEEGGGSAGVGVGATPMLIDSSVYGYTKVIQDTEPEDELNKVNLWVSVTDIESAINQRVKVTDESSF